jgi:hypothetical protein
MLLLPQGVSSLLFQLLLLAVAVMVLPMLRCQGAEVLLRIATAALLLVQRMLRLMKKHSIQHVVGNCCVHVLIAGVSDNCYSDCYTLNDAASSCLIGSC